MSFQSSAPFNFSYKINIFHIERAEATLFDHFILSYLWQLQFLKTRIDKGLKVSVEPPRDFDTSAGRSCFRRKLWHEVPSLVRQICSQSSPKRGEKVATTRYIRTPNNHINDS